ncbi:MULTISPECIES: hypothetical protein [unclassified Nostoc]|nr:MULTISPECIES: hypothetical protein [unclassified Nostoc]MDZ8121909.1 hypothetical protein [Nostoc sp. CmiVER01]MDZ8221412.1 hypothetical protein [Nostoc sp. ChiVER01]
MYRFIVGDDNAMPLPVFKVKWYHQQLRRSHPITTKGWMQKLNSSKN